MTQYLLDTNIVSFIVKQPESAVARRFGRMPPAQMFISSVVEAELLYGLGLLPDEAKLRPIVIEFLQSCGIKAWDSVCASYFAKLRVGLERQGNPMSVLDTMIAAHALATDATLVTNDKAFARVKGLKLQDWTKGPQRA